jgi:putrescine:ornithine antiporter
MAAYAGRLRQGRIPSCSFPSLAIGNVAIAISAVGYLAGFFPGMSATPIATCISVIALIWLTTVANFGGPSLTGKIGSVTVWGVIIPVAGLSVIGWFWFSGGVFMEAWNPKGMTSARAWGRASRHAVGLPRHGVGGAELRRGRGPKRDVPLACGSAPWPPRPSYPVDHGHQGIVPNAELAKAGRSRPPTPRCST